MSLIASHIKNGKSEFHYPCNKIPLSTDIEYKHDKYLGYKSMFVEEADLFLHDKFLLKKYNCDLVVDANDRICVLEMK